MSTADLKSLEFPVAESTATSSAILLHPRGAQALYVLAHGAGAGMRHPFMEQIARCLAQKGIATFRYQFPYMEQGRRRPDPPHLLQATVRSAVGAAAAAAPHLPLYAGGKSLGGRMTSSAAADQPLDGVQGLILLGFPLHALGRPGNARAEHLYKVDLPMLFLQGTRDGLANLEWLVPVCDELSGRATLHVVEGGDHSFKVPKRSGRTADEVMDELATAISGWVTALG
ncbi:MAG: alpha/beta family hydrolase [Gemmatimonadota bacterium]